MSRDPRSPDYAAAFVRLALAGSPLDEPICVTAVFHPPWLEAVAAEPGVVATTVPDVCSPATHLLGSDASRSRRAGAGLRGISRPPRRPIIGAGRLVGPIGS